MPGFDKVVIYGVGLIGGSFAMALKAAGLARETVGFGRRPEALAEAVRLGVVDRVGGDEASELAAADLVLLAMPVGQMQAVMARIAPMAGPHTLITDAGSTKGDVVAAARAALGPVLPRFVPAHPIAGAENSGAAAARADLYRDRRVVLAPLPETDAAAVSRVREAWAACGAEIAQMTPQQHDAVFAAVSHLPHLLSFALVDELAGRDNADLLFAYAASGFRDFTRIAASHPEMWRDICLANRDALLAELDQYRARLDILRAALDAGDGAALEQSFTRSRRARRAWGEKLNRAPKQ